MKKILKKIRNTLVPFPGSAAYWEKRYASGRTSGSGSYGKLAQFKAQVVNDFIAEHGIISVIEFGCGDGSQLGMGNYANYLGFDVSRTAIEKCRVMYRDDSDKSFRHISEYAGETAQLGLSLDVIYHLVENEVYDAYMQRLFDAATRFVVIYSTDMDSEPDPDNPHGRHRAFSVWVAKNRPLWNLIGRVDNPYTQPEKNCTGSSADFCFFEKNPVTV